MKKGSDLMRCVMLQEQSRRDGRDIAHLSAVAKFLALKLAELGSHPSQPSNPQTSGEALDALARAWLAAGHKAAEQGQSLPLPRRQAVAQEDRAWN